LILDIYGGAFAAWHVRKLRSAYTGNAIRVRRSSDNQESDIGFTAQGLLDTDFLMSFAGANSLFVTTWYDQTGNGYDVTQTTASKQARIVNAGAIEGTLSDPRVIWITANGTEYTRANVAIGTQFTLLTNMNTFGGGLTSLININGVNPSPYIHNSGSGVGFWNGGYVQLGGASPKMAWARNLGNGRTVDPSGTTIGSNTGLATGSTNLSGFVREFFGGYFNSWVKGGILYNAEKPNSEIGQILSSDLW
jgi:hypothetical protein